MTPKKPSSLGGKRCQIRRTTLSTKNAYNRPKKHRQRVQSYIAVLIERVTDLLYSDVMLLCDREKEFGLAAM